MGTVSFDRAVDYYDATRELPGEVRAAVTKLLVAELAGRGRCLEIGVGTGRVSLPLHVRGVDLVGADISLAMLRRLVRNGGGARPFPLVVADTARLPLVESSFGAVLASHVLHLVPNWTEAIEEVIRTLRPDGQLMVDFGGSTPMPWSDASDERMQRHRVYRVRPGVSDPDDVARYLAGRVSIRHLPAVSMRVRRSLRQDLEDWERQIHSWTWRYTADQMGAACADVREWARSHGWPLDETFERERVLQRWIFQRRPPGRT